MHRIALLVVVAVLATACGGSDPKPDVVASVQIDDRHDVVVIRTEPADRLTPVLEVCRVPHGEPADLEMAGCASVDPWRWSRTSIAASLDPGPASSLVVVVHDQARFDLIQPSSLRSSAPVELNIPAGPIGSLTPLVLKVTVADSDLTADNAIGCLATGLAGGTNPVFITSSVASPDAAAPLPPTDLQTACL